jgi:hypothetical protein
MSPCRCRRGEPGDPRAAVTGARRHGGPPGIYYTYDIILSIALEVTAVPGGKKPGPSVKKPETYEALRDKGMSKERAARISNAQANKEKKG